MSLKVYFDNTLIDEQYYTGLTNNNELFNESFKLGATACNQYVLRIAKEGVITQPSNIRLYDETTPFADLKIDNIEEQDYEYVYTLTDKMVDLNFNYDASEIFENGSTTLYNIVVDICTKVGLTLGTSDFRGYNKSITWYDNTRTAREYIGMVAELNGGFARIENNVLYFRKQKSNSVATIQIDDCENFTIGERHEITRVIYELGALKYEYGDETGNTLYLNPDNVFITEQSEVEAIYNDIRNFVFYGFKTTNCPINYNVRSGDVITFTDGTNNYPTIAQYDLEYFGGWIGGYNLDLNTQRQEETQIIGDKQNIKNLRIIVDRDSNRITQVIEEVDGQNTKISQVQQTVNELNSKIQDIADITTQGETEFASLTLTDINESEPIEIKIRPTTKNISYLYPRANLYPSETLYMTDRKIRFTNTTTDEVFDYILPDDLLTTGTVYDEFYLGYDQQVCQVIKRCEYNADGTVSALADEEIHTYSYPSLPLTEGDYTIELPGYSNGYMSVRLMTKNIYTSQFYTKSETDSIISQTSQEIELGVNQKLSNYSTTTEMNSAIDVKANQITSTVTQTSKNYTDTQVDSAKTEIKQTTDNISTEVSRKVGNDEVISKINQSSEAVGINANKINLSANDILNLLAGNTINISGKNINIASDGFNVDSSGKVNIISSASSYTGAELQLIGQVLTNYLYSSAIAIKPNNSSDIAVAGMEVIPITAGSSNLQGTLALVSSLGDFIQLVPSQGINVTQNIHAYGTVTGSNIQSDRNLKKNIKDSETNALDIINQIKHRQFEWKKDDKHINIGYIAQELEELDKNFVFKQDDTYYLDFIPILATTTKAVQEQQEQIEELKKEIKELKGEK